MLRKLPPLLLALVAVLLLARPAAAQPPNFDGRIYADDKLWATKGVTDLPPPNEHNAQSFDMLYTFQNGAEGQHPVAEAAPGNPEYNGGRWNTQTVTWLIDSPPVVTSYAELMSYEAKGSISIESANNYFECPLVRTKN